MLLLFSMCLAWALVGAARQVTADTRVGLASVRDQARTATAARVARTRRTYGWSSPARWALEAGVAGVAVTRTSVRGVRRVSRAARTGWTAGWAEGKTRHAAYVARRAARTGADEPSAPAARQATPDRTGGGARAPVCPECGEPTVDRPPTSWLAAWGPPPEHSHTDGQPLCPVIGDGGYRPADPLPGRPAEEPTQEQEGGGPSMTSPNGEAVNIATVRETLQAIVQTAEQASSVIDNLSASLSGADIDPQTLGEVSEILDAAAALKAAATQALQGLDTRHAAMEEAVNATPHAAKTDFYRH